MSSINGHPISAAAPATASEAQEALEAEAPPAAEAPAAAPAASASGSLLASRGAQHHAWLSKMWDDVKHGIEKGEQAILHGVEPRNTSGFTPPPPGIGPGALNILETPLARLHLMFAGKPYTRWVDEGKLMRGSEPSKDGFQSLRAQGVKTVVNLRYESNDEQKTVEKLGMKNVWLPVYDQGLPSHDEVKRFLDIVKDPANQPVYVHCEQGVGRTGVMAAAYRLACDGWTADQAITEARSLGMNSPEQEAFIRQMGADVKAGEYS